MTSTINKLLREIRYPVTKEEILSAARDYPLEISTMRTLERLPEREFNSVEEIMGAFSLLESPE